MPWAAVEAIAAIVGAGVSVGEVVHSAVSGSPKAPATPATPAPTPPSAAVLNQQKALVSQQLPNVIGANSGLANPDYDALIAKIRSGVSGQSGANAAGTAATAQSFSPANNQATNAAVTGAPVNLSDFINGFTG